MRATLSLIALIAGIWLVYMGYERAGSLEGKADNALSKSASGSTAATTRRPT